MEAGPRRDIVFVILSSDKRSCLIRNYGAMIHMCGLFVAHTHTHTRTLRDACICVYITLAVRGADFAGSVQMEIQRKFWLRRKTAIELAENVFFSTT